MFALMMYYSILIMQNVVNRYNDIRNSRNYTSANYQADSAMEFLLLYLKNHEAGYNLKKTCDLPAGSTYTPDGSVCDKFNGLIPEKDLLIEMEIRARAELTENLRTTKCRVGLSDISDECYVVPFPDTGNAGEMCKLYSPVYGTSGDNYLPLKLSNNIANYDQLDYSCNWNKLQFGSSMIDRVSIPL
jgi:hypothetical protein